jgi:hypothetical protein
MASIDSIATRITNHRTQLTGTQEKMVKAAPPEQQEFLRAQFQLQNESEATQQATNILKKLGEMSSSVIRNLA